MNLHSLRESGFRAFLVVVLSALAEHGGLNAQEQWPKWGTFGGNAAYNALSPEDQKRVRDDYYASHPNQMRPGETEEEFERRREQAELNANLRENVRVIEFVLAELPEEQATRLLGELLPEQLAAIREAEAEYQRAMREIDENPRATVEAYRSFLGSPADLEVTDETIRHAVQYAKGRARTRFQKALNSELLSHQMRTVNRWQPDEDRGVGIMSTLTATPVGDALGLSERDKKKLRERSAEIGIELRRALQKARRDSEALYEEVLSDEQAEQLKALYYSGHSAERPFVPETAEEILRQIPSEAWLREVERERKAEAGNRK